MEEYRHLFRVSEEIGETAKVMEKKAHRIDIRGLNCPYTFIKAKLALEKLEIGDILEILLDNEMALKNIPQAFSYQGQEYIDTEQVGQGEWIIRIKKKE